MDLTGRARLRSPGSIWGAPIPVLTNRKYLPIVDKMCALDRLGRSNHARPLEKFFSHVMMSLDTDLTWLVFFRKWTWLGHFYKDLTWCKAQQTCIWKLLDFHIIVTPSVSDSCNSFDIMCLSVCVSVCTFAISAKRKDIQIWILLWRSSARIIIYVKFKDQGHRSMVKALKTLAVILVELHFINGDAKEATEECDCA